ncbi:NADPH-dependent F420 reductase [Mycobacteroides abscessus]|uniref:NADPH-dependent F420 reductase n=1 Tax=Mycobacteroides abscessus TaxID=36809 RepID=UPI000927BFF7|nr:NAD(P)-binding domain-containing protein [Mycobacteroides abscessus]SHQ39120.1 reductase [Mycobacteroides abscessus subsp. abscessus]
MGTISIIGAGTMAAAIADRAAQAGHTVEVISRNTATAQTLVDQLQAGARAGTYGAAPAGDIVVLAVPYASAAAVVAEFGETLKGKVIIDITNSAAPDLSGLLTPHGSSGAQEIAKRAPAEAHVVKAFNTIFGHVLSQGGRLDVFIAADNPEAKTLVTSFIESLGLRPFDVGGLHMAQPLEEVGLMMIGLASNGAGTWDFALNVDLR